MSLAGWLGFDDVLDVHSFVVVALLGRQGDFGAGSCSHRGVLHDDGWSAFSSAPGEFDRRYKDDHHDDHKDDCPS